MDFNSQDLINSIQKISSENGDALNLDSLTMGYSMYSLFFAFVFSMVGFGYFRYGKKKQSYIYMITGVALMFYPYIVTSTFYVILVGILISAMPFLLKRFI